jgi:hypothetical protein
MQYQEKKILAVINVVQLLVSKKLKRLHPIQIAE